MNGGIDVLNAGLGHMEIRFKPDDPLDAARAERIIGDMLKRGYALFIEGTDGAMIRVEKFDPKTSSYIIADGPTVPPEVDPIQPEAKPGQKQQRTIKAAKARVTAVGRSAGG